MKHRLSPAVYSVCLAARPTLKKAGSSIHVIKAEEASNSSSLPEV